MDSDPRSNAENASPPARLKARPRAVPTASTTQTMFNPSRDSSQNRPGCRPSTPGRVAVCDGPWVPPLGGLGPLERKRGATWDNDRRNQMIGTIARAFAAGQIEPLWNVGLLLNDEQLPVVSGWTAVLVESAEHGHALLDHLRGWQLVHADPDDRVGDPVGHCPAVITLAAAMQFDSFAPGVLVSAMGGEWAVDIPGYAADQGSQALLVDVADDFDNEAVHATRRRLQQYLARGWAVEAPPRWLRPTWTCPALA
jgi:hypothetical protein